MIYFAYIPTSSKDEALKLAHLAVEQQLAACANIYDAITSVYKWEGQIQQDEECLLILKTDGLHKEALTKLIESEHSYDCPCITFFAADRVDGHQPYFDWVREQLRLD